MGLELLGCISKETTERLNLAEPIRVGGRLDDMDIGSDEADKSDEGDNSEISRLRVRYSFHPCSRYW